MLKNIKKAVLTFTKGKPEHMRVNPNMGLSGNMHSEVITTLPFSFIKDLSLLHEQTELF